MFEWKCSFSQQDRTHPYTSDKAAFWESFKKGKPVDKLKILWKFPDILCYCLFAVLNKKTYTT